MSHFMKISFFLLCSVHIIFPIRAQIPYLIGGDLSFLHRIENKGGGFRENGVTNDALEIFREHGYNTIRLRLWHTPPDGYSGLDTTLYLAKRAKNLGFRFLLDIHYSDTWADPGKQYKPRAWEGFSFPALVDSVYHYTYRLMTVFKSEGVLPEIVQVGNEITTGMLWPDGRVGGEYDTPAQWVKFGQLLKTAIRAIREAVPEDSVRAMIHIDRGGDYRGSVWFFDNLFQQGVDFDLIGLSYYPFWHGSMDRFQYNLEHLYSRYGKGIVVVETAYPWTLQNFDATANLVSNLDESKAGYPPTPEGQRRFLQDLNGVVKCAKGGGGIVYWEPEYVVSPGFGSVWENMALFDQTGEVLPALDAFQTGDSLDTCPRFYARVTLLLNAASIPDTVGPDGLFQIRGAVNARSPFTLSDGTVLDWSEVSEVKLHSRGGDYFTATLMVPVGRELQFKFWSQAANRLGLNSGWDLGETNDHPHGDTFVRVNGDTILPLHFFNALDGRKPYDWRPWTPKPDSLAVWFRVFLHTEAAVAQGYDPADNRQRVSVWLLPADEPADTLRIPLERENYNPNLTSYHLFSGVEYFPLETVGEEQFYLFALEGHGSEASFLNSARVFQIPAGDTTLHWVYYGNSSPVQTTALGGEKRADSSFQRVGILSVYPNPFNPTTTVRFSLPRSSFVRLEVFNPLGQLLEVLVEKRMPSGFHQVQFQASGFPAGVYFLRLSAGNRHSVHKILLLK